MEAEGWIGKGRMRAWQTCLVPMMLCDGRFLNHVDVIAAQIHTHVKDALPFLFHRLHNPVSIFLDLTHRQSA